MPTMPNLIGLQVQNALAYMVAAGVRSVPLGYFQVDPVTMSWLKTPQVPGFVVQQSPLPGANMAVNAAAVLTVSSYAMGVATDGPVEPPPVPGDPLFDAGGNIFILDKSRLG